MSMTYSLRRWVDPSFDTASEQAQMERVLEAVPSPHLEGEEDVKIVRLVIAPQLRTCRLCGHTARGDTFCLTCLADTME